MCLADFISRCHRETSILLMSTVRVESTAVTGGNRGGECVAVRDRGE